MSFNSFFKSRWVQSSKLRHSTTCNASHKLTKTIFQIRPRRTYTTASPQLPKQNRAAFGFLLGTALFVTSYGLGAFYPPSLIEILSPRPAPPPLLAGSPEASAKQAEIEEEIWNIPAVKDRLHLCYPPRSDTVPTSHQGPFAGKDIPVNDGLEYYIQRPYVNMPEHTRQHSLTAGILSAPGRLAVPPLGLIRVDEAAAEWYIHFGRSVCGHDGIVHGGMIATVLDETMARNAMVSLPGRIAVTASLTVNYRAPTRADQFVCLKTSIESVKGRKAVVVARLEDLEGQLLAEAKAVFVQPKYAHLLNKSIADKFLGIPEEVAAKTAKETAKGSD